MVVLKLIHVSLTKPTYHRLQHDERNVIDPFTIDQTP